MLYDCFEHIRFYRILHLHHHPLFPGTMCRHSRASFYLCSFSLGIEHRCSSTRQIYIYIYIYIYIPSASLCMSYLNNAGGSYVVGNTHTYTEREREREREREADAVGKGKVKEGGRTRVR